MSLSLRTLIMYLINLFPIIVIGYLLNWIDNSLFNLLFFVLIFTIIFFVIRLVNYLLIKREIDKMNKKLKDNN